MHAIFFILFNKHIGFADQSLTLTDMNCDSLIRVNVNHDLNKKSLHYTSHSKLYRAKHSISIWSA